MLIKSKSLRVGAGHRHQYFLNRLYFSRRIERLYSHTLGFPGGAMVNNPPARAGDVGLIPELARSLEQEMTAHSSILAWKMPWTEEPGTRQDVGSQRVRHTAMYPYSFCFPHVRSLPRFQHPHQGGSFITMGEPASIHHNQSKSIIYTLGILHS